MKTERSQCETCAWPLECSGDMKAQKPQGADCPREHPVWDRRMGEAAIELSDAAALDELVDAEPRTRVLMLV